MPRPKEGKPVQEADKETRLHKIQITFRPPQDIPLLYANKVVVNFTGVEFLLTLYSAFPDPWTTPAGLLDRVEGKPLARFAFSVPEWVAAVNSMKDQVDRLQAEGAFKVTMTEEMP